MPDEPKHLTFINKGQEYHGVVLGYEQEYFWLLVPDLNNVYVGHPNRIYTHSDRIFFAAFDYCQALDQIFGNSDEPESYIFEYSVNPEKIKRLIKAYKLINPNQSNSRQ